jgi:non-ribosomal peptide synthetase component F
LQQRFFERLQAELHNLYGPTEAAVDVTYWQCQPEGDPRRTVPIGRPVANTQLYILDRYGQPVPIGVALPAMQVASITVTAVNHAPAAVADTGTTPADTPVTISVLTNDGDPDGNPITVTGVTSPTEILINDHCQFFNHV